MPRRSPAPKPPWWCSLWVVIGVLVALILANVTLWSTSSSNAEDRERQLRSAAVKTMQSQMRNRIADIAELNSSANSQLVDNPGENPGTTLDEFIRDADVFDKQTGVLAIISSRPPTAEEGEFEVVEGFGPERIISGLSAGALGQKSVQTTLDRSRLLRTSTVSGRLDLEGAGLNETLGGDPRVFLVTTPIYKDDVLVRNLTSAVWGDMLVTAVLRDAPEFTEVTLEFKGEGIDRREVGRTLSSTQEYLDDASLLHTSFDLLGISVKVSFKATYTVEGATTKSLRLQLLTAGILISVLIAGLLLAARQSRIRAHHQVVAALEQVSDSEARFRGAFEAAPIGMFLANSDGAILQANRSLAELANASPSGLLGHNIRDLVLHHDQGELLEAFEQVLRADGSLVEPFIVHLAAPSARQATATVSLSLVESTDSGSPLVLGQFVDITEREQIRARLEHQSIHDALTNLPNRVLFMDRLTQALHRTEGTSASVAVIFVDLDRFKLINDSLGHRVGDAVVVAIAARISATLRPSDTVARFGGDEFVVLCDPVNDPTTPMLLAERISSAIRRPLSIASDEVFVTASVGVALGESKEHTAETLLRDADAAMYRAKADGRSRIRVSEPSDHRTSVRSLQTGNDLHKALERDEFRVFYQPLINLETGAVAGFEALVRWQHPSRGLVMPADFVPLAEESGLIVDIGRWVFSQACRDLSQLSKTPGAVLDLAMSINVAPGQLAESSLIEDLAAAIDASGVNPDHIWIEITESTLMRNVDVSARTLRRLRGLGVHIGVDDFGTGYSSLAYLRKFPVETLKIDKSFVDGLGTEPGDTAIVTAVVSLAHALGLETVAEGVEHSNQVAELRTLGCQYAQGFLLGMPMPFEDARALLAEGPWVGLEHSPI